MFMEQIALPANASTVLIVDDDQRNRKLLDVFLRADGHRTLQAASGAEALQLLQSAAPDLLLLDLMMPGMDGFDLLRAVRATPRGAQLPVIVVSALDDSLTERRVLEMERGADDFLRKPVDRWELATRIQRLLARQESNAT